MAGNHVSQGAVKGLGSTDFKGHDWQDKALKRLPKALRDFVLYDCVADVNLASILRHVKRVGAKQALADTRAANARLSRLAYGDDYPVAQ